MTPPFQVSSDFTPDQKRVLEAIFSSAAAAFPFAGHLADGRITADPASGAVNGAEPDTVFGTPVDELCKPERWKLEENPLDIWDKIVAHADRDEFPNEADTFRFKYHGLFHVAPAQDSFMLRIRVPAGELTAQQLHGLADMAADWGGGCAHITTRANIQIREFRPRDIVRVLVRLQELGLTSRGSGADNIRNITATPTSGFDSTELLDVRPYAKALHHYILNHRDLYGLPRKFNVAFDSGGSVSAAADTNDIGFVACRVSEEPARAGGSENGPGSAPGIYFGVELGGITGHGDFARNCGVLIKPSECVAVAAAMIRVFNENGDRTNRKKARLKYLLEKWGVDRFIDETQRKLAFPLARFPVGACGSRRPLIKQGWIGPFKQAQPKLNYIGVGIPVGRMSAKQMHILADTAEHFGKGELRLTVWQNLIIPHIADGLVDSVCRRIRTIGLATEPAGLSGGVIACTGSKGCKYAAADTKGHATSLAKALANRELAGDQPVNIHFTGCAHSCAQHYCGDIGFLATQLASGGEGYHVVLGGGMGDEQGIGRELFRGVEASEIRGLVERILKTYEGARKSGDTFVLWSRRHTVGQLQELLSS